MVEAISMPAIVVILHGTSKVLLVSVDWWFIVMWLHRFIKSECVSHKRLILGNTDEHRKGNLDGPKD